MQRNQTIGYLPDERPPIWKLLLYAIQQVIVMFPATIMVALLTGFHVSTTIFASGLATICFVLVTGRKLPLYYGSSFSYLGAILGLMSSDALAGMGLNDKIAIAQFGIVMSGLVSIAAGFLVKAAGKDVIDRVLPASITGPIAMAIGLTLAGTALTDARVLPGNLSAELAALGNGRALTSGLAQAAAQLLADAQQLVGDPAAAIQAMMAAQPGPELLAQMAQAYNLSWTIALVTLLATILFSVYLKGVWGQLPLLLGPIVGCAVAYVIAQVTGVNFFRTLEGAGAGLFALPVFTLPKPSWMAVAAIMPIAIATIPESTAHVYQLDIYVNDLSRKKGGKVYDIASKLGLNLIGDGIGDIVAGAIGGPAGTNYGENISAMAITKVFSTAVLMVAAVIAMVIACFTPLINAIYAIPTPVIAGLEIYLFGAIAAQGVAIMIEKKVDMFSARNIAVIATIMVIALGGQYGFGGQIPFFGTEVPCIAGAAVFGILLNYILSIGARKGEA
ncbi:MAG: xanthine permease [Clostridiales bacterium]|nr:xanthine permease [Clostridiales bacterium]